MSSCKLLFDLRNTLEEVGVAVQIQSIGRLRASRKLKVLGEVGLRLGRGKPSPQLTLARLEVIPQLDVIRQRREVPLDTIRGQSFLLPSIRTPHSPACEEMESRLVY